MLDDGENKFLINVDPSSYSDIEGAEIFFPIPMRPRIHIRRGLPVTWGGFSQITAWLDAYRFALDEIDGWQFAIMMSGSCIPLVSQEIIKEHLLSESNRGLRVHCYKWGWKISSADFNTFNYHDWSNKNTSYVKDSIMGRVEADIEWSLVDLLQDHNNSPVFQAHRRGDVLCNDLFLEKKLVVRSLLPHEAARRAYLMSRFPVSGGWLWSTFRRDALQDIVDDDNLDEILELLSTFLCPDELFLPTLLNSSSRISEDEISYWNFYLNNGQPFDLASEDFDKILHSDAFFGRKLEYRENSNLVCRIEEKIEKKIHYKN